MRQGQQHRRGRGRNNNNNNGSSNVNNHAGNRKGQNPLTRSFESNGPDVKVRGTPAHVAEKYMQLARDAQSVGDHVLAENYLQHAEHYNRIILAYREQQGQQSGDMNGRPHHMPRNEQTDGDDGSDDVGGGGDDRMASDPQMYVRHPGADQPSASDMQPSLDEPRQHPRHQGDAPRFRDRPHRQDRQDRPHRSEGYDRGDRPERSSDRGYDRDRGRDRPYQASESGGEPREMRQQREPREHREPREPRHIPRDGNRDMPREAREPREPREPRDVREPREVREPRDVIPRETVPRDVPRDPPREMTAPIGERAMPPPLPDDATPPVRESGPRRRERFGLSPDQPEFLRRPVRRPRREPDAEFGAEPPAAAPPVDETPRD